jgi:hypothetical protein
LIGHPVTVRSSNPLSSDFRVRFRYLAEPQNSRLSSSSNNKLPY